MVGRAGKRLADLTAADLRANPVWRYEGGTGATAVVAPAKRRALSQSDDEVFLAATDFELFDSSPEFGFCFPADDSGIDYLQPVIVTDSGHVSFWFDVPAASETLARQWAALGKQPAEIFPVSFRCLVPVDGRVVTGRIASLEFSNDIADTPPSPAAGVPTARPVDARPGPDGSVDRRTARRRKAEMTVEFTQDALRGTGIARDFSRRGMFVQSQRIPGSGPALRLSVNLADGRKLVLTGRVIRTVQSGRPGFGIRLAGDSPEYDELLSRLRDKGE